MNRLSGKVALITGAASGIGEATTRLFVEEGASVAVADIQDDRGQRVVKELGPRASYVHVDVAREADVQAAIERVVKQHGRLDCLFNNAVTAALGEGSRRFLSPGLTRPWLSCSAGCFSG